MIQLYPAWEYLRRNHNQFNLCIPDPGPYGWVEVATPGLANSKKQKNLGL